MAARPKVNPVAARITNRAAREARALTRSVTIVPVVIVIAVSLYAPVFDAYIKWAGQAESDNRVTRNAYCPAARFAAVDRSDDISDQAVIPAGFDVVLLGADSIALAVHDNRFEIQIEIV